MEKLYLINFVMVEVIGVRTLGEYLLHFSVNSRLLFLLKLVNWEQIKKLLVTIIGISFIISKVSLSGFFF